MLPAVYDARTSDSNISSAGDLFSANVARVRDSKTRGLRRASWASLN